MSRSPVTNEEMLLFEILDELKKLNALMARKQQKTNPEGASESRKVCKSCGKVHDKQVDYAICAKKSKKKEG